MSTSLSRFTAALMAGSQENTMALAALNFDFSLYKVEAPKEYQALGSCLSDERRHMAEGGSQHVTARKLGALFRTKLPKVPNLLRAFGERVSEIAKQSTKDQESANPSHNARKNVFAQKMGIDGTTIWAAATSGTESLCAQLLACMLARFWAADEATAIWAEIVETRKAELFMEEDNFDFSALVSMQAAMSREQLAEWDASARAWLKTADSIKVRQQTQLRLIMDNLDVKVNNQNSTYDSVMDAWVESMKVVDKLVAGMPQSVHTGAPLVGLSAWHLFPNMMVYTAECKEVVQDDPLVNDGGLLTVGLRIRSELGAGVRWSLPLAKLRYYGDPVIVAKYLDLGNSRVSINQLMVIALGSLAIEWPEMPDKQVSLCRYYEGLGKRAKSQLGKYAGTTWILCLAEAASNFLQANGDEKKVLGRLMDLGTRRGDRFLNYKQKTTYTPIKWDDQMLGMTRLKTLVPCLATQESRIEYLRKAMLAADVTLNPKLWLIAFRTDDNEWSIATALPSFGLDKNTKRHCRWVTNPSTTWEGYSATPRTKLGFPEEQHLILTAWQCEDFDDRVTDDKQNSNKSNNLVFRASTEDVLETEFAARFKPDMSIVAHEPRSGNMTELRFQLVFGNPRVGAIYKATKTGMRDFRRKLEQSVGFEEIMSVITREQIDFNKLIRTSGVDSKVWLPLQALGAVKHLYKDINHETISLDVIRSSLVSRQWCPPFAPFEEWHQPLELPHANSFSCIANMETGYQDLDPDMLKDVMAMPVSDSIFALSTLTSDPYMDPRHATIDRTFGNIGKYGMSLIIPPPEPRARKPNSGDWNIINHDNWDGTAADSFAKTSLHLSLTDYRVPYTASHRGNRDIQAFFQEAVVSIFDGSLWVGDIDVIKTLKGSLVTRIPSSCSHRVLGVVPEEHSSKTTDKLHHGDKRVDQSIAKKLGCMDNWYELLDNPQRPVVVRSRENWLGRLAITSLSAQLGYKVVVLEENECPHGCFGFVNLFERNIVHDGSDSKKTALHADHVIIY